MTRLAMFPLGGVLMPHMPMPLRVFEPRYLTLLSDILAGDRPVFGTVLIERGQEVGGGDVRFDVGTLAEVVEARSADGSVLLVVRGAGRFRVEEWFDEQPYPTAEVTELPDLVWDDELLVDLDVTEREVRSALVEASEFVELPWPIDVELDDDPVHRAWQLAGIAPVGPVDDLAALRSDGLSPLLARVRRSTADALDSLRFRVGIAGEGGPDDDPDDLPR